MNRDLSAAVARSWDPDEYPALAAQADTWMVDRPLAGMRVLDATPVYANTMVKYAALLAGGAQVTVGAPTGIPADADVLRRLPDFSIAVATPADLERTYDVVLDCAGAHAGVASRFGYAELTRSGLERYAGCPQPVVMVDSGLVKQIETTLGTGDGFLRAMVQLGHPVRAGAPVVVLGGGKVGFGVAAACRRAGAAVTVVDPRPVAVPEGADWVDSADAGGVAQVVAAAWCVVSATGRRDALAPLAEQLVGGRALLANMGAEDEFGAGVPAARALNGKVPVNFVLAEPTRLRYLDPTLALSNAAALELADGRVPAGVHAPDAELERSIMAQVRAVGTLAAELDAALPSLAGLGTPDRQDQRP